MKEWKEYQEKNKDRFLNEMLDFFAFLLSAQKVNTKPICKNALKQVKERLLDAGC